MKINRRRFSLSAIAAAAAALTHKPFVPLALAMSPAVDMAHDPRRPQFHLLPAANWMNDPNGPVYFKGHYHMFYQYNPNGAFWGDMHWAHDVSPDMVHWNHLPVALSPTPGGPDTDGCFSGTAVITDAGVTVIYTGVVSAPEGQATIRDGVHSLRETQCLATSTDPELRTWTKLPVPVIARPPQGLQVTGFRDPSLWHQDQWWYMVVGSGVRGRGGAVLLYRSHDLHNWEYLHIVAAGVGNGKSSPNPVDSGDMWECPDLFPLGDKHVLIHSAEGKAYWQTGVLDQKELIFHPEHAGALDHGSFYAPKTQLDKSGNRILWGWIPETRKLEEYRASGWAGMMSLPRVLTLSREGQLRICVAPVVESLRSTPQVLKVTANDDQNQRQVRRMAIANCSGEVVCVVRRGGAPFGLSLSRAQGMLQNAGDWLALRYDPTQPNKVTIDDKAIPIEFNNDPDLELHLYIDRSVMEVFVNKQAAYTKRFYYPDMKSPEIGISITGKTTDISRLSTWQLSPISHDRLTT